VRDRVALTGRLVAVHGDRALAVEVASSTFIAVEVVENRGERFPPVQDDGRLAAVAVHVDREDGVVREERLLPCGVATVGAMGVGRRKSSRRATRSAASVGVISECTAMAGYLSMDERVSRSRGRAGSIP